MKSLRSRGYVYGLVIMLGLLSALPNLLPQNQSGQLPDWYLNNTVSLGLDLQGGSHLLLQADIQELFASEREAMAEELARTLREAGIHHGRPQVTEARVELPIRQTAQVSEAASMARELARKRPTVPVVLMLSRRAVGWC